ncbi:MAG: hypothetical protein OIN84_21535 [Candidatus Methanoperedens sp.]|nr:hypothetical protein [Candidatus Methanoperedens sp.]
MRAALPIMSIAPLPVGAADGHFAVGSGAYPAGAASGVKVQVIRGQ